MLEINPPERRAEFSVDGRRAVVMGAARSGLAAAELLAGRGASVIVSDIRSGLDLPARLTGGRVRFELGEHRVETLLDADLVVVSPGVPPQQRAIQTARQAGVPVISEIELASRWLQGRLIAVTGTKGKSTTTVLAGRLLEAAGFLTCVGGNIGQALSTQVERSTPDVIHVVEASSFQLECTDRFHPWIAVFLNVSPDHLDRHPSLDQYALAKTRIFVNQDDSDWLVVNADEPQVLDLARHGRARQMRFALKTALAGGVTVTDEAIVRRTATGTIPLVPLAAVQLPGRHLLSDVLAAVSVAAIAGVPADVMEDTVANFHGLEHTLEPVMSIGGVQFVNDSKATNIKAARCAIESVRGGVIIIAGGRFKGGDLRALRPALASCAQALVSIGEAQPLFREAFADLVPVHEAGSMAEAVRRALALAPPNGTVLLAPACASFDMFRDYAERGRCFKEEVARLARAGAAGREP